MFDFYSGLSHIPLVLRPTVVWLLSFSVGETATSVSSDSALGTPTLSLLRLCGTEIFTAALQQHQHMCVCVCNCMHTCALTVQCIMCICTCYWVDFLQHDTKLFQVTQTGTIFHRLAFTPRKKIVMVIAHKVILSCQVYQLLWLVKITIMLVHVYTHQLCYITCVICSQSTSSSALLLYTG